MTEKLAVSFKKLNTPCKVIMTLYKIKNNLPGLKPVVPKILQNTVVYVVLDVIPAMSDVIQAA